MADPILEVNQLQCSIQGQQVVEDVSLSVASSGITAILGRNGAGKTSTLKGIIGLITRKGQITLAGKRIEHLPTHRIVQEGIGYVPEDREVFSSLTVAENLTLAQRSRNSNSEFVESLFPDLVKRKDQYAGTLSGGQQQMVALARALLNDNKVLLVDEPTKGLAPKVVDEVVDALYEASKTVPVLLVEQNLDVVRNLAKTAFVIASGRVIHTAPTHELLADEELVTRLLGVHSEQFENAEIHTPVKMNES